VANIYSRIKNKTFTFYIIFSLLFLGYCGLLVFKDNLFDDNVKATTIIVDKFGSGDYTSIQKAVDNATSGDTIHVKAGIYYENVIITKNLTIIGEGPQNTTINTSGSGYNFFIGASWVNISGFNFTNAKPSWGDAGIATSWNSINNCIISNNVFYKFDRYGIKTSNSNNFVIKNNTFSNINWYGAQFHDSTNFTIINNTCLKNGNIDINGGSNHIIANNTCRDGGGIYVSGYNCTIANNIFDYDSLLLIDDSYHCPVYNNIFQNNSDGIWIMYSFNTIIRDNHFKNCYGIQIINSYSTEVFNNTFRMCGYGFWLRYSLYNYIHNNTMEECGIIFQAWLLKYWNHYVIDTSNTINNRPVYYWKNKTQGVIPSDAGQIILANCTNIIINDQNSSCGIILAYSSYCTIKNATCGFNFWYNVYFYRSNNNSISNLICFDDYYWDPWDYSLSVCYLEYSPNNTFYNCTNSIKPPFLIHLKYDCKSIRAINCTFNLSIPFEYDDYTSDLMLYNYLHLHVRSHRNISIKNADVEIVNDGKTVYSTSGYGGKCPQTDFNGQIKWIKIPYKYLHANDSEVLYKTKINVKYKNDEAKNNNRIINMSNSHFEYFEIELNVPPNKVYLKSPINNSYINDSTPNLNWIPGFDEENDTIWYNIQIKKAVNNWKTNLIVNKTEFEINYWKLDQSLNDGSYNWRVCANDGYDNGSWSDVWKFTIDTTPPESYITIPINNQYYTSINYINGTAIELEDGSGLSGTEISIKRLSDNSYWNGYIWSESNTFLPTTGKSNWSFDSSSVKWTSGVEYLVKSRAIDNIKNIEISKSQVSFYIDFEAPLSIIQYPISNSYLNEIQLISGIAKDFGNSGIDSIKILIKSMYNNSYWDGNGWSSMENWLKTTGKSNWSYNARNVQWKTDNHYAIKSKAIDNVGNEESSGNEVFFMYDNKTPDLSIMINSDNKYTNSYQVILYLMAFDSGSGISGVAYSNDNIIWSPWERYNETKMFNLKLDDGSKDIYFKAKDKANNTAVEHDSIILDTTPPNQLSIIINNGNYQTNNTIVKLSLFAFDSLSGVSQMSFSEDGENWSNWEYYTVTKLLNLSSGDGIKTIYFKVKDLVGNIADPVSTSIILNTSKPNVNETQEKGELKERNFEIYYLMIIVVIIVIIVLILFFIRFKQNTNESITSLTEVDTQQELSQQGDNFTQPDRQQETQEDFSTTPSEEEGVEGLEE
jgi:parallel beta-helix repeat protein